VAGCSGTAGRDDETANRRRFATFRDDAKVAAAELSRKLVCLLGARGARGRVCNTGQKPGIRVLH